MNRRSFNNLLAAGVPPAALAGCRGNAPEAETVPEGRKAFFKTLPVHGAMVHDWLPKRDFGNPEFVPLVSPPSRPPAVGGKRDATVRFRKWQSREFARIRSARQHLELSLLEPRERELMQSISDQIGHKPGSRYHLRYSASVAGTFERVRSLDLLGVRSPVNDSWVSYAEDSDPELQPLRDLPDELFSDLSLFSGFQRLFFNYANCKEGLLIDFLAQRARPKLECLGVPNNLSVDEFAAILDAVEMDVVDLSGHELDWGRLVEMLRLAFGKRVRWAILTGYVSYPWIHLKELLEAADCPRGCIIGYDCIFATLGTD